MLLFALLISVFPCTVAQFQADGHGGELLSTVVSILLHQYFRHPFQPVLIYHTASTRSHHLLQRDILDGVLPSLKGQCSVAFGTFREHGAALRSHAVLLGQDLESIESILKDFNTNSNDYSGRYLLVLTGGMQDTQMERLFAELWLRHIVHVNVLVPVNASVSVYSYQPYSPEHCGHPKPELVATLPMEHMLPSLYPVRRFDNLHNCTLKVGTFEAKPYTTFERKVDGFSNLGGFEGELLHMLSQQLNFRFNVVESPGQVQWGAIGPPGNSTGTMQLAQNELVDFIIACMALDVTRSIYLKAGVSHYASRIVFAVPQGRPYTAFEKLFKPFQIDIWASLGAMLLGVLIVVTVLSCGQRARALRQFVYGQYEHMPLFNALNVLLGGAVVNTPRRNFARSLFVLWLYFTFVVRTLYQGSLYLYLQRSATYPPLSTIEEVHNSALQYHMVNIAMRFFVDRPQILPRVHFIPPGLDTLGEAVAGMAERYQDRVVVCPIDMVAYNNKLKRRKHLGKKIYVTRESITFFPLTIYYPKKSFLTQVFDHEIKKIIQSGIINFWVRNYGDYDLDTGRRTSQTATSPRKLTLKHMVGAYQILLGVHLLAIIVFLFELASIRIVIIRRLLEFCMD
ncbi:uncharacterized protein LOC128728323 [Anopheles nili]|uniref:uncharacterized protein LOC128728323 n=1 Tax=Anopheles nili TaxID=185578 RepID=UPI00237ABE3E|nr:uncharacterized protein LOC128728323 [Anopheles nili]